MRRKSRILPFMLTYAAMLGPDPRDYGIKSSVIVDNPPGPPKRRFRRGPCEICGKPNVRAGRERGIYLCAEHMEANQ